MHLNTVRANAMKFCREYPFVQEKVVGYFSTQNFHLKRGLCPSYCWIYYSKCLFQIICAYDCFLNNSRTKVYKNLRFLPLGTRHFRILEKKTNRMYKMKRNRMNENIHRMKKVTSEMEFRLGGKQQTSGLQDFKRLHWTSQQRLQIFTKLQKTSKNFQRL
jgi:hypothetical protein